MEILTCHDVSNCGCQGCQRLTHTTSAARSTASALPLTFKHNLPWNFIFTASTPTFHHFSFFSPIRFKFSENFSSAKCQSITGIGTGKKNYYNWGFWNDKEQKLWKKPPFWYCRSIFEKLRISKYQKLNSTQIWNKANLHHSGRWTLEMITRAGLPTTHRKFSMKSKQLF